MKRVKILLITFSIIILSIFTMPLVHANDKKIIRVGYPIMGNISKKDADGNYYGYDYEYLKQIAQYTGWEYQFVEVEGDLNTRLMTLLDMLSKGEIDLLGGLSYNDGLAQMYDYTSEPYGYTYETLIVKNDSVIYDQNALISKKNVRVVIDKKADSKAEKLRQFAKMNNFTVTEVRSERDDLYSILNENKADALLTNDMTIPEGYRVVSRFFPEPFYFAATKGNSQVVAKLNQALISIGEANPTFSTSLYNRYFKGDSNDFILNNEEKEYILNHQTLKVLVSDNHAPVQYVESSNIKGISKDILDNVEKQTKVRFEYTVAKDYEELKQLSLSGDYDIVLGLPYEMKVAETFGVTLTNPYLSGNVTLVASHFVDPNHLENYSEGKTLYTLQDYSPVSRLGSDPMTYETSEDILFGIEKGKDIQYAYLNSYLATYYINKNSLKNVSTFTVPDYLKSQYSFGVKKTDDFVLLGILNKAISSMEEEVNSLIYKNASIDRDFSFLIFIQDHLAISICVFLIITIFIVVIIRNYYMRELGMKRAVELEYKRYQMLHDMTGEMTFVYNYLKDELKISQSGLNKLAHESVTENFVQIQEGQAPSHHVANVIYQYIKSKEDVNDECELTLVNGEKNWYQMIMKLVSDTGKKEKQAVYAIGKILDIQKVKTEKETLKHNSLTDPLTGIWNRAGAVEMITKKLEKCKDKGSFILLDLDNFKEVNDRYGHLDGDIVLQQTAEVLKRVFSRSIVARLGGDEFVVFSGDVDRQTMKLLCTKAIKDISELPYIVEKNMEMSMSMGVVFTDYSHDLSVLMKCADEQMYEVKRSGKKGYSIFDKYEE